MARLGRRAAGVYIAVMELALDLAIVLIAAEPQLDHGGQLALAVDHHGIAVLRPRNHVAEQTNVVRLQRAESGIDRLAAILDDRELGIAGELVAERGTPVGHDDERLT